MLLTTSATLKRCRDHFFMCRLLRQRKSSVSPRLNGVSAVSVGAGSGAKVVCISCDWPTSPPAWRNTILTGPTPRTHQTVRTPLPYGSPIAPACVMSDSTFAAITPPGNAGTLMRSRPR